MIAQFFGKLAALARPQAGGVPSDQANWSIRVPCPGGKGASSVGFGVRVPSAGAPFCTSGGLGTLVSGAFIGTGAATAEISIESILLAASDTGRLERTIGESEPITAVKRGRW
jgi:hypothetical protein